MKFCLNFIKKHNYTNIYNSRFPPIYATAHKIIFLSWYPLIVFRIHFNLISNSHGYSQLIKTFQQHRSVYTKSALNARTALRTPSCFDIEISNWHERDDPFTSQRLDTRETEWCWQSPRITPLMGKLVKGETLDEFAPGAILSSRRGFHRFPLNFQEWLSPQSKPPTHPPTDAAFS